MTTTNCLPFYKKKYCDPHLAVNADGTLLASVDRLNHCVHIHSLDSSSGECTDESVVFGTPGWYGRTDRQMSCPQFPCFVHRSGVETLLVCDWGNDRVVELSVNAEFMRAIPFPEWSHPFCVAYNSKRDVIAVSLWSTHNVELFGYNGAAVDTIAMGTTAFPTGIAFTGDGEHLLVTDFGNHRVSKFRVADGALVVHLASRPNDGLWCPRDVLQRDDGSIVVAHSTGLTVIGLDGGTETVLLSDKPLSLVYSPMFGVIVSSTQAKSFVLNDAWLSTSRYAWLAATAMY